MTLIQEAYVLMQGLPESNIKSIVDLLHTMYPYKEKTESKDIDSSFKRTGSAEGIIQFPEDFDEHFDDLDQEISELFNGSAL